MPSVLQNIRDWLTELLQATDMWPTDNNLQEIMLADLEPKLIKFITGELMLALPSAKLAEFVDWSNSEVTKDQVLDYFQKNLVNMDELVAEALQSFSALMNNQYAVAAH